MTGKLEVAICGAFAPCYDVSGNKIRNGEWGDNISINIMLKVEGFSIIFSWPSEFENCASFADSLARSDKNKLPNILLSIIFSYVGNTFFSKNWFHGLEKEQRVVLEGLARIPSMYERSVETLKGNYTDWIVIDIIKNGL